MTQTFLKLKFGQPDSHVKTCHLPEWVPGQASVEASQDSFTILCDSFEAAAQEQLSSKMCMGFSLATEDVTSRSYSRRWTSSGMVWRGACLTAKTSESPSNAVASTLLPCIETHPVPEKYFLSQNAATGILRRVDRMGRNLPPSFRQSLEILAKGR